MNNTTDYNPLGYSAAELDHLYNARASVPDCLPFLKEYADYSAQARAELAADLAVPYGSHPDETLDIFPAEKAGAPVFVFIHGGYWRALTKDDSSFMAPVFHAAGATVVAVNYSLAPAVSVAHIVGQCRAALAWVHKHVHKYHGDPSRIHVSGSSAGGHLAGMLLADGWHDDYGVPTHVVHSASPISGLFDLRPLITTHINEWARLDIDSAARSSPILHLPGHGCPIVVAWGEHETPEFKRQSRYYADAWRARGFDAREIEVSGVNHFNILMAWRDPGAELTRAVLGLMGLPAGAR